MCVNLVYSNQNRGEDMKNLLLVFHILLIITLVGCTKDKGVYVGEGKDGKRHGQGTVTYSNGKKYVGEFKNGKKHGQGTQTWSDGDKYVGGFKENKRHGKGTYEFNQHGKGDWNEGRRTGQGSETCTEGKWWFVFYEGGWKNSKFHGQGKLVITKSDPDGTLLTKHNVEKIKGLTLIGEFKNRRFWNLKSYNDAGEQQTFTVVYGKWTY